MRTFVAAAVAGVCAVCSSAATEALPEANAFLIAAQASIAPGQPVTLALVLQIQDGWHTYWINPGDAGAAPRVQWTLPPGFQIGDLQSPTPDIFAEPPLASYGYARQAVLLTQLTPPDSIPADSVTVTAQVNWLVCKDVCLPVRHTLSLQLPVARDAEPTLSESAALVARAREQLPRDGRAWNAHLFHRADALALHGKAPAGSLDDVARAVFLPTAQGLIEHTAVQTWEREGDVFRVTMKLAAAQDGPPARVTGILRLEHADGHVTGIALDVNVTAGGDHVFPVFEAFPEP